MKARVRVLGLAPMPVALGLAGVECVEVSGPAEAEATLQGWCDTTETGVVLVDARLHDRLSETMRAMLAARPVPLVVPFPGPAWQTDRDAAEAYIVDLLRRAIGYRVKLA